MAFLTPCFVRADNSAEQLKLIEWLEEIGYKSFGKYMYCSNSTTVFTTFTGLPVIIYTPIDDSWFDCGTNIDLFKALAAMNDENDREQWFVVEHEGSSDEMVYVNSEDTMAYVQSGSVFRKATAEEIVEYFTKIEK